MYYCMIINIIKCAYRLQAAERKIDVKVRNIGQQKCYNDLRNEVDCKSEGNILGVKKWL